jgi:hypothetical protein
VRRRRLVLAVLAAVVTPVLAVAGTVIAVHLEHPRDEAAYLEYLRLYGQGVQTGTTSDDFSDAPIALPSIPALIAEGDRACDWLGHQDYALWRTDPAHRVNALYGRYDASVAGRSLAWVGPPDDSSVAGAAWAHLCPATLELHKPHFVFTSSQPD